MSTAFAQANLPTGMQVSLLIENPGRKEFSLENERLQATVKGLIDSGKENGTIVLDGVWYVVRSYSYEKPIINRGFEDLSVEWFIHPPWYSNDEEWWKAPFPAARRTISIS